MEKQLSLRMVINLGEGQKSLPTLMRFRELGEETVERILKDFGLTPSEAEVYVFLAKRGVLKSREVARQLKKDKAQILRVLKSLEGKGLVESTFESPKRFSAVPFEKVLDAFVKAKRDEANLIESTKKELLLYWKSIGKTMPEAPLEKFVVIEGTNKIYSKISQMITETKNQLSTVSTISGLLRADHMGLFDAFSSHPLRSKIQLRFLTESSDQNQNAIKTLLEKASKANINFRGRAPDLGLRPFPPMVIRDDEEVLLFVTPQAKGSRAKKVDRGIWTNCKTLVQTFASVFEDLWRNATDTQQEIPNSDSENLTPKTFTISTAEKLREEYDEALNSAEKEIIFMASSQDINDLWKNTTLLRGWSEKGVSVRILAPTTVENLKAIQQLSKYCEIRHFPESRLKTTIIDGIHLFQFNGLASKQEPTLEGSKSEYAFYTSDSELITKTKSVLNDSWRNALVPSSVTLESILNPPTSYIDPFQKAAPLGPYFKGSVHIEEHKQGVTTEKDIVNKILNTKRIIAKDPTKDMNILCGSNAQAAIHPPKDFDLPDMTIIVWRCDKQSSWGAEDWLGVSLWLNTPIGYRYVPVAHVTDNSEALEFRKGVWAGTPAGQNCQLVTKDQFQVQVHGNTLFAGWTVPIPLFPPPYVLPPSCMLFEGYGEIKTTVTKTRTPSGRTQVTEANQLNAFVTFFHPASKYSGLGTEGLFNRDVFFTAYPPSKE
jgi:sugar-specific transcriptional regulator TrmB